MTDTPPPAAGPAAAPAAYVITAKCGAGHVQSVRYEGLARSWVEHLAGLMDGTSPLYLHPPGPESIVGKCGLCGAAYRCTVTEEAS